ncbi:E492 group microcin [Symbiopectobacterium purcellii]|uniref:E492 group microcin n=1 Tax=Symbiopectobacterium purcellii TaxID=2871826 RepID=UPI003F85D5D9
MREIDESMLVNISGAGNDQASTNKELLNTLGENMAWGAGGGAVGGIAGAAGGAVTGAIQTVVQEAVKHGPVSVPIPVVPMGPTWNGSGGGASPCALDKELAIARPQSC